MTPSGLEIAPAATFPPPCPLGSIAALSAWLFWKANCDGAAGVAVAIGVQRLNDPQSNKKRAGEAGSSWGMPGGRIAKRSGAAEGREPAGAKPPRGGAFLPSDRA